MVRPAIEPLNRPSSISRISAGSRQWLVGPGVLLVLGADEGAVLDAGDVARVGARQVGVGALGLVEALEGPRVDQVLGEASYSSAEPSHQWIESGWVSSAISSTQASSLACLVGAVAVVVIGSALLLTSWRGKVLRGDGHCAARAPSAP